MKKKRGSIDITIIDNTSGSDDISTSAVALSGLAIAEQPSMLSNLAYSNTVASTDLSAKGQVATQHAANQLRKSILSIAVNQVQQNNPLQARAVVDVLTNNEVAQSIADLKSVISTTFS